MSKVVFTTSQAAKLFGVTTATVQKMVDRGELLSWKTPGGHRRICGDSATRLLSGRKQRGKPIHSLTALIIDDSEFWVELISEALNSLFESIKIYNSTDMYDIGFIQGENKPDILILDMIIPNLDTKEVFQNLRKNIDEKTCIFIITANYRIYQKLMLDIDEKIPLIDKKNFNNIASIVREGVHGRF